MAGRNNWTREQTMMTFRALPNPAFRKMGQTQSDRPETCGPHPPLAFGGGA